MQEKNLVPLLILGTGIFAEEVADIVSDIEGYRLDGFVENLDRRKAGKMLLEYPIHWVDDLPAFSLTHQAVCAIGSTKRSYFIDQAKSHGMKFATLIHPHAHISKTSTLNPGCIVFPGVIVASHTTIKAHVIINRNASVGHHTKIGNFVTISPAANVAGLCCVEDNAYIAMGSNIIDRISVGSGAIVGAGAVAAKNVPERTLVMGVPARVIKEDIEPR